MLGQYDEAIEIYKEVLRLRTDVLGEIHPDTFGRLAELYSHFKQGDKALSFAQRVLNIQTKTLNDDDPDLKQSKCRMEQIRKRM